MRAECYGYSARRSRICILFGIYNENGEFCTLHREARIMSVTMDRRHWLSAVTVGMAGIFWADSPVFAHHGFVGKHDFARPMFLRARVVSINASLPHVRMKVRVPRGGGRVPKDREWMRPLEDAEARATMTIIQPFDKSGDVELTFDWRISRAILDDPSLIQAGDELSVVVYRRTARDEYHGELLVVLLRTAHDEVMASSRPPKP